MSKEKQYIKQEQYFMKMIDYVKEDIKIGRDKSSSYFSAFNNMPMVLFDEFLNKNNLKYDY